MANRSGTLPLQYRSSTTLTANLPLDCHLVAGIWLYKVNQGRYSAEKSLRNLCELVSQIALLLGTRRHVAKHLFLKPWCQENRWRQLAGWAMWIHMNSLLHCLVVIDNGFAFAGAYLHKTLANHGGSGGGVENKKNVIENCYGVFSLITSWATVVANQKLFL